MRWSPHIVCTSCALIGATQGCGRVGFDYERERSDVNAVEAGASPRDAAIVEPMDGGEVRDDAALPPADAGASLDAAGPRDAATMGEDARAPLDAQVPQDASETPMDAQVERDAGGDEDSRMPVGFDCGAFDHVLFCSGFDALAPGVEINERGGNVSIDDGLLSVSTWNRSGTASIAATFAPVFSGELHARFKLRVPSSSDLTAVNLFALTETRTASVDEITVNLLTSDRVDVFVLGTSARFFSDQGVLRRDEFQCVGIAVAVDDEHGSVRVELDGEPVIDQDDMNTYLSDGVSRVALGIDFMGLEQVGTALEIDDFVLSREPLPSCP